MGDSLELCCESGPDVVLPSWKLCESVDQPMRTMWGSSSWWSSPKSTARCSDINTSKHTCKQASAQRGHMTSVSLHGCSWRHDRRQHCYTQTGKVSLVYTRDLSAASEKSLGGIEQGTLEKVGMWLSILIKVVLFYWNSVNCELNSAVKTKIWILKAKYAA